MNVFRWAVAPAVLAVVLVVSAGEGVDRSRRQSPPDMSPAVGDEAPDFELVTVQWLTMSDAERTQAESELKSKANTVPATASRENTAFPSTPGHIRLSSFRGKKPVVFALTSYT